MFFRVSFLLLFLFGTIAAGHDEWSNEEYRKIICIGMDHVMKGEKKILYYLGNRSILTVLV